MTSRILTASVAALLLAPAAFAITETWDGGSLVDSLFITGANWLDNTAPASDLEDTDLIFGAALRLNPALPFAFSADSITFNNMAGAYGFSGARLNVGGGGIVNNDTQTMTFTNDVSFGGVASSEIRANTGGLTFSDNIVFLPFTELTVSGSENTTFANIANFILGDTGRIEKIGSGTMTCSLPASVELLIQAGTVSMAADGGTDVFSSTASIAVNNTSVFIMNESLTLSGAQLTRADGAFINLAAGKTLTVQNGADVDITGSYTNSPGTTITVTGAGSTFSTTSTLAISNTGTLNILAGGDVTTGSALFSVGSLGGGSVTVDGNGSSFNGGVLQTGSFGGGEVTFRNESTGQVSTVRAGSGNALGTGTVAIESGAAVVAAGLEIGTSVLAGTHGTVTITGEDSTLTLVFPGGAIANIGAASLSTAALNVQDDGTFHSGAGLTTVNATGTIAITTGGFYDSEGSLTLNGGQLTRDASGAFQLDATMTLRVQAGGDALFTGSYSNTGPASAVIVTGTGSTLATTSFLTIGGGSTLSVMAGGSVSSGMAQMRIGTLDDGTATVNGAGSSLSGSDLFVGLTGYAGSLTFSNGSTGTFGVINVTDSSTAGTSGTLNIQSGASVTAADLDLARQAGATGGTLTITGAGSTLTINGAGTPEIGAASTTPGTLNVQNSGAFHSGTGLTTVNATGTIAITGGTCNANGNLTLNGGQLTRDAAGTFNLTAGRTLTVQAGGDALFTGNFTNSTSSTIAVTGTGSTLSTPGILTLNGGSILTVATGGSVSSGAAQFNVGTGTGSGTVTVDGLGSSLGGAILAVAQTGNIGSVTFSNGSTGAFTGILVDSSAAVDTNGTLSIQSGASVTGTSLAIAPNAAANIGTVTITGAGSALTLTGAATAMIGATNSSIATLTVGNGGTFTTGTGLTTVNATGDVNINPGGTLTGASDFAGTGPVNIAGAYRPGAASGVDQTTSVSFAQDMTFQPTTGITMELGGVAPGTHHDQLVFNGPGPTHVTWNGTLILVLINGFAPQAGQTFDLFNFDAARDAGSFTTINLPALPAGLTFNFDDLYTSGIIRVVSTTGTTFAQWAAAVLGDPGAQPHGDHNANGYDNLQEYALAFLPVFPGASEPAGGRHVYAEGERMRVLFWRHIDRTDVTIRVQVSTDFVTWNDLAVSGNSAPFTGAGFVMENRAHPLSEPGLVEVRDIQSVSSEARRYLRILITLSP